MHAVQQPRAHGRRGAVGDEHGRLPVELGRQPPQRAQEQPQRGALLLVAERDPDRAVVWRALERGGAGPQHDVLGREDPLHQLARGLERGAARVEAAEEQLDEAPRHLGREHPLGRGVEVPTLSEREWRSATDDALGANGSWTWTNSIGAAVSASSIVREMSSGGAGIAPRRAPASGSSSPTPSTRTPPSGSNSSPARIRRRDSRTRPGSSATARARRRGGRPRPVRPPARATNALTSCSSSHG